MIKALIAQAGRAGSFTPDARGLMPLARARALVAKQPLFFAHPRDDDAALQQWAALLSLADTAEAERAMFAITWNGYLGLDFLGEHLVARYSGELVVRFLAASMGSFNVLHSPFHETLALLQAIGSGPAFELGLLLATVTPRLMFKPDRKHTLADVPTARYRPSPPFDEWLLGFARACPEVANPVLMRRATVKDQRAKVMLEQLGVVATKPVKAPTADDRAKQILAGFDRAAAEGAMEWPRFGTGIEDDPQMWEYFELRLLAVAAPTGDGWGVCFERLSGSCDAARPTQVQRYLYGSTIASPGWADTHDVAATFTPERTPDAASGETLPLTLAGGTLKGPAGPLKLDAGKLGKRNLKPGLGCELDGDAGYNLRLRAYVDAFPGAFFSKPTALLALLGIAGPVVICDTTAFAHAAGKQSPKRPWHIAPSKSPTYQSLAAALVARDPRLFVAGDSNLDFRLHAVHKFGG